MNISGHLTGWYEIHKRDLPWRNTNNPYLIWVSEIILQQTRVNQGMAYYQRFIEKFPDVKTLAESSIDEVLKLWQGLGYYNRAKNLHETARYIHYQVRGQFPGSYEQLIKLKGVGEYTAAAIASFAFGEPVAVVDGNVQRVIARLKEIDVPVNTSEGKKLFKTLAQEMISSKDPATHNQAIIEFGAIQCTPKKPYCESCPLSQVCFAFKNNSIGQFPVKIRNKEKRTRYFYYLKINKKDHTFLHKREIKDIWDSLYQFPLIESEASLNISELTNSKMWHRIFNGIPLTIYKISDTYTHVLTHQKIFAQFLEIEVPYPSKFIHNNYLQLGESKIKNLAVPRLIEKYLEEEDYLKK